MADSIMVFRGGPKDGEETEPHDGWPAPGGGAWPDQEQDGVMHEYTRVDTVTDGDTVRHLYDYRGER